MVSGRISASARRVDADDSDSDSYIPEAEDALDFGDGRGSATPASNAAQQHGRPKQPPCQRPPAEARTPQGMRPVSASRAAAASQLPGAVQQILQQGQAEDQMGDILEVGSDYIATAPCSPRQSEAQQKFIQDVRMMVERQAERQAAGTPKLLQARTFLNAREYSIGDIAELKKHNPGSLQLMYMFYSRIYAKLVGKQKGVDIPLFDPINLEARNLGFRAVLDWAHDFKLLPDKVGRRELERIFCTVHAGPIPVQERFASKLTFPEFIQLVSHCGSNGEPMDRSKIDNSRIRTPKGGRGGTDTAICDGNEARVDRVRRLATFLSLGNVKKVKVCLHNLYRDVHFWKLSDGADFDKEARAAEMRSRPQRRVEPLPEQSSAEKAQELAACKCLMRYAWLQTETSWEEFEAPCLDMGAQVVGGDPRHFRLELTNRGLSMARIQAEAQKVGSLRFPWRDTTLGAGQTMEVPLEFVPTECGEWSGELRFKTTWVGRAAQDGVEEIRVPTYMSVLTPSCAAQTAAGSLPIFAPRPFNPGCSASCRVTLDPANFMQFKNSRPLSSLRSTRPGSAASTAGTTRASSVEPGARLSGSRLCSARSVSRGPRPSSGGLRGIQLAQEAQFDAALNDGSLPQSPRKEAVPPVMPDLLALDATIQQADLRRSPEAVESSVAAAEASGQDRQGATTTVPTVPPLPRSNTTGLDHRRAQSDPTPPGSTPLPRAAHDSRAGGAESAAAPVQRLLEATQRGHHGHFAGTPSGGGRISSARHHRSSSCRSTPRRGASARPCSGAPGAARPWKMSSAVAGSAQNSMRLSGAIVF